MKPFDPSGPAFPCNNMPMMLKHVEADRPVAGDYSCPGMSLRDYFAAAALTGLLADGAYPNFKDAVGLAYEAADAMLKERDK